MSKYRIYDLVHIYVDSEGEDQKAVKQKQSELTKLIISICNTQGVAVKSASSSIEDGYLKKIIEALQENGYKKDLDTVLQDLREISSEKKTKGSKTPPAPEPVAPQKKQLKIVRRIKPGAVGTEEAPAVVAPQEGTPLQKPIEATPVVKVEQPVSIPNKIEPKEIRKPAATVSESPVKEHKKSEPTISMQPFRVAKPTMVPSMMGRTKRPTGGKGSHQQKEKEKKEVAVTTIEKPISVVITTALTVKQLSDKLSLPETEIVKSLFSKGIMKTVNQTVEMEIAVECAKSLGYEVITEVEQEEISLRADISNEADEDLLPRPPVVTIMGHVDHGKTSLLDAIRETKFKITDQESGGITQHIGAYQVEVVDYDGNKRLISFLDTPGHEAFTAMRARGAQVTDIAILVVAADDGVMPQTIEALNHAKAAGVPIVIAMNKIDKPEAQPDRVLGQLAEHDLLIEDYGGKTVCSKISAKKRLNLDDLLTKITLVADAELQAKLRANPNKPATGAIIEAQLSKEKGPIAHLLVQNGTLKKGDCLVAGTVAGRVRAMFDDHGKEILEAPPSMPVEIIGLPDVPQAGDIFQVYKTYQEAKEIALQNKIKEKEKHQFFGLVDFASKVREGQEHELKVIIKADVQGSAEAIANEIVKLSTKDVLVRPVHVGSGNISENDINLASSTHAIVIGFHVSADANAQKAAVDQGIDIRLYEIIYKITEDLEKAVLGLLEPEKEEVKLGVAEVRQVFTFGKGNKIAGSYVLEGKIQRNQIAKVYRDGKLIFEGKVDNLKRFKDDAREVQTGFECGISFEKFHDLIEGDKVECWTIIEKERTSLN